MDARKPQRFHLLRGTDEFGCLITAGTPATKRMLLVKKKVARSLPLLHSQRGQCSTLDMRLPHALQINRADHVDIMQNERLVQTAGILEKEPGCFFQPAARIE